jgi:peroxiredoxin Q/BCP
MLAANLLRTHLERRPDMVKVGSKAPAFCLPSVDRDKVCLKDFAGRWTVLYFYPKDNTGG